MATGSYEYSGEDWWAPDAADKAGEILASTVRQINQWQIWRKTVAQRYAMLYAGHDDGDGVLTDAALAATPLDTHRNVCRMAVDATVPKVAKHRPLPQVLSTNGEWKDNKRARRLTQYLGGIYDEERIFEKWWPMIVRDALVFPDGWLKVEPQPGGWTLVERALPWEIYHDAFDARYGQPRSQYHVHTIDCGVALARYGKRRKKESKEDWLLRRGAIEEAATSVPDPNWDIESTFTSVAKRLRVVHGWHLCDDEQAHKRLKMPKHECNGRRCTAILNTGEVLLYEDFDWPDFPVIQLCAAEPLAGVRGIGMVRRLEGWQEKITNQADKVDDAHRLGGGVAIIKGTASGVVKEEFTNDSPIFFVNYEGGVAPTAMVLPTCDPSVYQREREMVPDAINEMGISTQSAMGQKHPGITSGIALETIDDIEDERWTLFGRASEAFSLRIARAFIRCEIAKAKELGESSVEIQVKMKDGFVVLRWADVLMNDYQVRVFPSSVLPQQIGNRLEKLQKLFSDGVIDRQTFLQQLDAPDLSAEVDIVTAGRVAIDEMLEAITDAETQEELDVAAERAQPSAYLDYKWMQLRAQYRILKAYTSGVPEKNIQELRDICDACEALKKKEAGASDQGMASAPAAAQMPLNMPNQPPGGIAPSPGGAPPMPPGPMPGQPPISAPMGAPMPPGMTQ